MSDQKQTPLIDLMQEVPADAQATYEHHATHHSMIPYGKLCQEAATEIIRLRKELAKAQEQRGTLACTEQGPTPLGEQIIRLERELADAHRTIEQQKANMEAAVIVAKAPIEEELAAVQAVLDAWHSIFSTTQLSHAQARLDAAEKGLKTANERLAAVETLKKRANNQRKELRRLNKYLGPYWSGFRRGINSEAECKLRGIVNAAFGQDKVRAAEHAALDKHEPPPSRSISAERVREIAFREAKALAIERGIPSRIAYASLEDIHAMQRVAEQALREAGVTVEGE